MKLSATSKYVIAASLGAVLCFSLGYAVSHAADENQGVSSAAVLNNTMIEEKREGNEGDFSAGTGEWNRDGDRMERIQAYVDQLSDEQKQVIADALNLNLSDFDSVDEETLEKAAEAFRNLDEEQRENLLGSLGMERNRGMKSGRECMDSEFAQEEKTGKEFSMERSGRRGSETLPEDAQKEDTSSSATRGNEKNTSGSENV